MLFMHAGRAIAVAAAPLAVLALPADVHAQPAAGKPGKAAKKSSEPTIAKGPMLVVVPYASGGGADVLARAIAPKLSERSGYPANVENRPGANGTVGIASVAKAAGDGHTMLVVAASYASNPLVHRNLAYDHSRDLASVSLLASGPLLLVVHPSLQAKSAKDLIALAKGKPGRINFGSPGAGTLQHLSAELFKSMAGINMIHAPYKTEPGGGTADVVSDKVPVHFMNVRQALPLVRASKARALGATGPQRTPAAPEIPTIAESGLAGYEMTSWYAMLVPSSTPPDVVKRLSTEVGRIVQLAEIKERMAADGMTVVGSTPEYFSKFLVRETAKYARVVKSAGIQGTP